MTDNEQTKLMYLISFTHDPEHKKLAVYDIMEFDSTKGFGSKAWRYMLRDYNNGHTDEIRVGSGAFPNTTTERVLLTRN
jgi:hypothetical protein